MTTACGCGTLRRGWRRVFWENAHIVTGHRVRSPVQCRGVGSGQVAAECPAFCMQIESTFAHHHTTSSAWARIGTCECSIFARSTKSPTSTHRALTRTGTWPWPLMTSGLVRFASVLRPPRVHWLNRFPPPHLASCAVVGSRDDTITVWDRFSDRGPVRILTAHSLGVVPLPRLEHWERPEEGQPTNPVGRLSVTGGPTNRRLQNCFGVGRQHHSRVAARRR